MTIALRNGVPPRRKHPGLQFNARGQTFGSECRHPKMAQSGQSNRTRLYPLLGGEGHHNCPPDNPLSQDHFSIAADHKKAMIIKSVCSPCGCEGHGVEMIIPFLALPITLQIAVADGVPNWDVTASCRNAAAAVYADQAKDREKSCLESEQRAREKLESDWSKFPAGERIKCVGSIKSFEPTYTELTTCLEMYRDVKSGGGGNPVKPTRPR
ncbi:MAG: hypothetical protein WA322_07855 [Pseudolabrys sp.]